MAEIKPTRERLASLEQRAVSLKEQIAFCRDMDKLERSGALNVVRKNITDRLKAIEGKLDGFLGMDHDSIIALLQNRLDIRAQSRMYEPQGKRLEAYQNQLENMEKEIVEYRKKLRRAYG